MAHLEQQDHKVIQVLLVQQEQMAHKDRQVMMERLEQMERMEQLGRMERMGQVLIKLLVIKVLQEQN
jgi:hypothetical protein